MLNSAKVYNDSFELKDQSKNLFINFSSKLEFFGQTEIKACSADEYAHVVAVVDMSK